MATSAGPNLISDGLVFGYDTGYPAADNTQALRFNKGEPTTNLVTTNLETLGTDGSGQSSVGTRTTIAPNHVRIVDVASNTRQTHLISGLTASTTYTVSIQFKKVTGTPTFRFQIQGYSNSSYVNTIKFTNTAETGLLDIDGWQTAKWTFTLPSNCNAARIWWQDGADYTTYTHTFELKNPQLEAKSHNTPYINGTRSSTQSLIDLKRTTDINVSNVSFDSNAQMTFDGTDDEIELAANDWNKVSAVTVEAIVSINGAPIDGNAYHVVVQKDGAYSGGAVYGIRINSGNVPYGTFSKGSSASDTHVNTVAGNTMTSNKYYHLVYTRKVGESVFYQNGVQETINTSNNDAIYNNTNTVTIGQGDGRQLYGDIPVVKIHNRVLSAEEVKQNFNAYKKRFGI